MEAKLQVALDLKDEKAALRIAKEAVAGGADWIEAGTPLIKSCGMSVVRKLKEMFPDNTIVADMKTMDTGAFETEIAAEAGADVVCVLAVALDDTIKGAVEAGKKFGVKIAADLICVEDPARRAEELEAMGVDYVILHIGVDKQYGKDYSGYPFMILKEIKTRINIPVAAAGGLKKETVKSAVDAGANILIVGGAITKSEDPEKAACQIKGAM